ncbi:MAG: aspartyl-phosphate phosphatase Spo0E family protein [Clostridiaceae bacterium]|jgi:hypothetical protein|nr:aspartyl-phosphate phosphatase Spo0E family protein [Clostridiaceae bacterium]
MKEIEEVLKKIEELRSEMNELIRTGNEPLDVETIEISKLLDEHLVEFHRLLQNKQK